MPFPHVGIGVCDGIRHSFNRFCCLFARLMIAACPGASNAGEVIATVTRGSGKARGWRRIGNDGRGTEGCSAARGTFLYKWAFSFDILQPKNTFCRTFQLRKMVSLVEEFCITILWVRNSIDGHRLIESL